MSEWVNELMSNTPLNPLSRGDLKVSLRDAILKWIPAFAGMTVFRGNDSVSRE